MKDINYNLKPNELAFGRELNEELRSIHENFQSINTSSSSVRSATKTLVEESETTIASSEFDSPITSEPKIISVFLDGEEIQGLTKKYVLNGTVYDILITTTDEITNAKINVLC